MAIEDEDPIELLFEALELFNFNYKKYKNLMEVVNENPELPIYLNYI